MADTQETAAQRIENIINDLQIRIFSRTSRRSNAIRAGGAGNAATKASKGATRWYGIPGGDGGRSPITSYG